MSPISMGLKIFDSAPQHVRVVLEAAEGPVAVETEHAADGLGQVIVVDMLGGPGLAHRADATLGLGQSSDLFFRDALAQLQKKVAFSSVESLLVALGAGVVARFAVRVVTGFARS